jgi:hypothetical protein
MRRAGTPERIAFYVLQGISIDCIAAQASLMKKVGAWLVEKKDESDASGLILSPLLKALP